VLENNPLRSLLSIDLDSCSVEQLRMIRDELDAEVDRQQEFHALVKSLANVRGFSYATFEVFGALQDGVTVLDQDLNILWANRTVVSQLNRAIGQEQFQNADELAGKPCYFQLGLDAPCEKCTCLKAMNTKKTVHRRGYHGPLNNVVSEVWAIPIYNGKTACILITREKSDEKDE